jgi:hypothetical protein
MAPVPGAARHRPGRDPRACGGRAGRTALSRAGRASQCRRRLDDGCPFDTGLPPTATQFEVIVVDR